jgi:transposase
MSLTRAEFAAWYAAGPDRLFALFRQYEAQVAALTARVEQLEARLGGHSQHRHRSPSSDGPRKPPRAQRARRGRAPGGQPGHPGHTLAMTAAPDRVVAYRPPPCAHCGAALAGAPASAVVRRQVVDLPALQLAVTEHRAATVGCPHCQRATTAPFPAAVTQPVQYGPRVLGLGVYLRHYQLLPYQRIGALLADLFGRGPSGGTLHRASLACAAALAEVEAAVKGAPSTAAVAHADETSVAVAGQRRWAQVLSTARLPHYAWHAKRGHQATDAIGILPRARCWSSCTTGPCPSIITRPSATCACARCSRRSPAPPAIPPAPTPSAASAATSRPCANRPGRCSPPSNCPSWASRRCPA